MSKEKARQPDASEETIRWYIRLLAILEPAQRDDDIPLPLINVIALTDGKWLPNPRLIAHAAGVHCNTRYEFKVNMLGPKVRLIQFTGHTNDMKKAPAVAEATRQHNFIVTTSPVFLSPPHVQGRWEPAAIF